MGTAVVLSCLLIFRTYWGIHSLKKKNTQLKKKEKSISSRENLVQLWYYRVMYVVGFPHIPAKKKEKEKEEKKSENWLQLWYYHVCSWFSAHTWQKIKKKKKKKKKAKIGYSCGVIMYVVGFQHIPGIKREKTRKWATTVVLSCM